MANIYISSTYTDLKPEREVAAQAVHQLGHKTIAMEDYVSSTQRPVDKCLQDVRKCDAYVGIFAWRYGFIPNGYDKSITHLEYETAYKAGIPCLIFLLEENAPWPVNFVSIGDERNQIEKLRNELKNEHVVSFFKNADQLRDSVSKAVDQLILVSERSFIKFKRPEDLIGMKLGKYVIREKLGKGGKGVVFKVLDTLEEKEKAIKMVPPRIADSLVAFTELKKEVNIATAIRHPNVVIVLGLEKYEGHFFIVMEYIEGKSLEQILAESTDGKLDESEVIAIMKKLGRGLAETHKSNVIHRDIKPSNVMCTPGGEVKILDFGISYQVTTSMTELVGEHHSTGTWPYMAPEQLSTMYGRENKQVDIWGFGVTMYQLLAGKFPFMNKDQIRHKDDKPYELPGVSARTRQVVMKCLEKDRKKRFQNMQEVLAALDKIGKVKAKTKIKEKEKEKEKDQDKKEVQDKRSSWLKWGLVGASIIVLVVFYVIFLKQSDPSSPVEIEQQEQPRQSSVKESIPIEKKNDLLEEKKEEEKKNHFEQPDNLAYKTAENENTIRAYQEYLEKYPSGKYVNEAKERIEKLEEMPEDVRKVASKASIGIKIEKNANGFWEADYGDGINMVYIPAGTFTMGSNDGEDDEKPPHQVSLDGYWMGKYEVTKKQYMKFVNDTKSNYPKWLEKGNKYNIESGSDNYYIEFVSDENLPIVEISWDNAVAYCKWLSNKKGLNFKLPTEAQWEMAAGGREGRKYPWGDQQPDKNLANFGGNISKTTRVGYYPKGASPYGLLDMAGNVWEWCNDWYDENYYRSSPGKNPVGPKSGSYRVMRGGSWGVDAGGLRCAYRDGVRPSDRNYGVGFRLCQDN